MFIVIDYELKSEPSDEDVEVPYVCGGDDFPEDFDDITQVMDLNLL